MPCQVQLLYLPTSGTQGIMSDILERLLYSKTDLTLVLVCTCTAIITSSFCLLQEFRFLRALADLKPDETLSLSKLEEVNVNSTAYFDKFGESGSPFDEQAEEETEEDVLETNGVSFSLEIETLSW